MSQYKPYPAYKDSGVEWLGQVPEHWSISSVKWEFKSQLGKMLQPEKKSPADTQVPYHKAVSVQWERVADEAPEMMWASPSEIETYCLKKGDLLICEGGDVGRAAIFNGSDTEPTIIQNSIHRVRSIKNNQSSFLLRLLQHCRTSGWFDVLCSKATIVHFTAEKLGDLALPLPSIEEQKAIINYLDRETTRIDALITKKTRFIELLREKRQALITHAVTKGLDPNVKMKDSGVEWLGEVPEHWEIRPLKAILEKMFNGTSAEQVSPEEGAVKVTRIETISRGELNLDKVGYIRQTDALSKYKLLAGDIQFSNINSLSMLGNSALFKGESELYAGMNLLVLRPRVDVVPKWLHQVITSSGFRKQVEISGKPAINQASISQGTLGSLFFPVPCREEQFSIAAYLDRETNRMDTLITKTTRSIELLKERRSALITAAVTGQIDLREAA